MRTQFASLLICVLLPSCASQDPYVRDGVWRPIGSNEKNLQAMIADPDDLITGAADNHADGQVLAAAVARYRAGHIKGLPDGSASKISPITVNTGSSSSPASDSE